MFRKLRMRFAKKRDVKKIAELFREINTASDTRDVADMVRDRRVVVLQEKKKFLGAFSFIKLGIGIFSVFFIRKLIVDKKFRGKGLGSVVLKKLRSFTRKKHVRGFFLWSLSRAKKFYEKNRLQNVGRIFWWLRMD